MAWRFGSAGSFTCRAGPPPPRPLAAFDRLRACLPPVFPSPSLLFPTAQVTDWGRVRGCGREVRTWRPSLLHCNSEIRLEEMVASKRGPLKLN